MTSFQIFLLITVFVLAFLQCNATVSNFRPLEPSIFPGKPSFSLEKEKGGNGGNKNEVCQCELGGGPEGSICANNGIVYKNECQFNCSKKTNPRLRIVQKGATCAGVNRSEYWSGPSSG